MNKVLQAVAVFALCLLGAASLAQAHHNSTHSDLILNEQSTVSIRILVCTEKADADSILIANEQGGRDAALSRTLLLLNSNDKAGNSKCAIVSGFVTPLIVYRRTVISVQKNGKIVKTEGTLMRARVNVSGVSKIYFSAVSVRVEDGVGI